MRILVSIERPGVGGEGGEGNGGGEGGVTAPCVFQRLRQVGKELDGELAQVVPPGLTSAQTDSVIPPGTLLPSGSLFAESRIPPSHLPPHLSTPVPLSACAPPGNYIIEYQRFNSARVHLTVPPCEAILLITKDLTIERCTGIRKARERQERVYKDGLSEAVRPTGGV